MTKRKMLSSDQQAKIRARLTDISKRLRKWPYPIVAPKHEIADIISELEGIMRLNMVEHYGPVTLFDRAVKWQRRAQIIRDQRQEAIKRRAAGETLAEIAKSYAVDISMISRLAPGFRSPFEASASV
jgi:hypothetical protein